MVGRLPAALALDGVVGARAPVPMLDWRAGTGLAALGCGGTSAGAASADATSGGGDTAFGAETSVVSAVASSMTGGALCRSAGSSFGDASGVGRAGLTGMTPCAGASDEGVAAKGVSFSFSFSTFVRGGHSRFSFASSLCPSPVSCDTGVPVRGGIEVRDCLLVCCSNRPMRFATLWRGLSSGKGL